MQTEARCEPYKVQAIMDFPLLLSFLVRGPNEDTAPLGATGAQAAINDSLTGEI